MAEANFAKMTSMHFYAWKNGLKTGQYYLRTRPSRDAIKFTVDIEQLMSATDAGDNDEILKCLNINPAKMNPIGVNIQIDKRDTRLFSQNSEVSDKKGEEEEQPFNEKEVEDVVFECINCSG